LLACSLYNVITITLRDSQDFKVRLLGQEAINNGEKIYWSYDPNEIGTEKPSVEFSLQMESARSGRVLAGARLKIEWEDQDTAKSNKPHYYPRDELTGNVRLCDNAVTSDC